MFAGDAASLLAQRGKARLARAVQRHVEAGSRQLLGDRKADPEALDAVSIEKHIDAKTPPVFVWHTVPDDCVPYENTLMLVDACKKAGVSVEAHLFPSGGHGLSLGTAETAWQGVNGIEPCVQVWPKLAIAWMRRTFADTDAATTGSATADAIAE